jgi:hypothetical protein
VDTLGVAIVSAAAALGGSAVTGIVTSRGVKRTLDANSRDLGIRLDHESSIAREERNQERFERAYVPLLEYVNWVTYIQVARQRAVAARGLKGETAQADTAAGSLADDPLGSGMTEAERKVIVEAGPTTRERAALLALVTAVASDPVLKEFERFKSRDRALVSKLDSAEAALRRGPKKGTVDQTISQAIDQVRGSGEEFSEQAERLKKLVNAELRALKVPLRTS